MTTAYPPDQHVHNPIVDWPWITNIPAHMGTVPPYLSAKRIARVYLHSYYWRPLIVGFFVGAASFPFLTTLLAFGVLGDSETSLAWSAPAPLFILAWMAWTLCIMTLSFFSKTWPRRQALAHLQRAIAADTWSWASLEEASRIGDPASYEAIPVMWTPSFDMYYESKDGDIISGVPATAHPTIMCDLYTRLSRLCPSGACARTVDGAWPGIVWLSVTPTNALYVVVVGVPHASSVMALVVAFKRRRAPGWLGTLGLSLLACHPVGAVILLATILVRTVAAPFRSQGVAPFCGFDPLMTRERMTVTERHNKKTIRHRVGLEDCGAIGHSIKMAMTQSCNPYLA